MTNFDLGEPAEDADDEEGEEPLEAHDDQEPTSAERTTDGTGTSTDPRPDEIDSAQSEPDERDPTETGPAFPYSEVKQSPLYAREETWTQFEDEIATTVVPELRQMEIRDDELREIHDVALEIVLDNLDEIPERLAEKRQQMQ